MKNPPVASSRSAGVVGQHRVVAVGGSVEVVRSPAVVVTVAGVDRTGAGRRQVAEPPGAATNEP
ncbi:hypothetical protein Hbl1158_05415 [Halobaculum sp. CBA1158]|uniref:hypothetical protein n=1 Tax=Halobaculum sp. CBA1158 TaxID=2904243 RepID=UPI001F1C7BB6|nr:hypothetical protein [Halobaculum sp. CBA1158]UIP00797.1 hypothetical protein Hbl1158_05415 [Halobaculum sp. CBA1158]